MKRMKIKMKEECFFFFLLFKCYIFSVHRNIEKDYNMTLIIKRIKGKKS